MLAYILRQDATRKQYPWLDQDIKAGTQVYS